MNRGTASYFLLVGVVYGAFYLATATRDLSIAHDAASYLAAAVAGDYELHPNHLLYGPLAAVAVAALEPFGVSAQRTLSSLDAVAGGMVMALITLILVQRFRLRPLDAALAGLPIALSFGVWFYSAGIEIYIPALVPLLGCLYLLTGPMGSRSHWLAAGALHGLATLLHQSHILFALVPLVRLASANGSFGRRAQDLVLYGLAAASLVGTGYLAAAIHSGAGSSVSDFLAWVRGYGTAGASFWKLPPQGLILAAIGIVRAHVGALFIFAVPSISTAIGAAAPLAPYDGPFLVRDLGPTLGWVLTAVALLGGLLSLWCAYQAVRRRARVGSPDRHTLVPVATALLCYSTFFLFWQPQNPEFWIPQLIFVWLIIGGCLLRDTPAAASSLHRARVSVAAVGACFGVVTFVSAIWPARSHDNDYFHAVFAQAPRVDRVGLLVVHPFFPMLAYGRLSGLAPHVVDAQRDRAGAVDQARTVLARGERVLIVGETDKAAREVALAFEGLDGRITRSDPRWIVVDPLEVGQSPVLPQL